MEHNGQACTQKPKLRLLKWDGLLVNVLRVNWSFMERMEKFSDPIVMERTPVLPKINDRRGEFYAKEKINCSSDV